MKKFDINRLAEAHGRSRSSEKDNFSISGPRHLVNPDWSNPSHRRSIAASLVKGVHVLQKDRILASPWWTFFNFRLTEHLVDRTDGSIFAAVFQNPNAAQTNAPAAVVAFRGTIRNPRTLWTDSILNLEVVSYGLNQTSRFQDGLKAIKSSIKKHRHVWIAGHSLGAALAMAVGRRIREEGGFGEEEGFRLQYYLFNPPFPSAPRERIDNEGFKFGVHVAHSFVTAGLALSLKGKQLDAHDAFEALKNWIPNLYVNPRDDICSGYVGYFGNRERMQEMGIGKIADIAARHSLKEFVVSPFRKGSKASHLIPSARLTVNINPSSEFREAHGIRQWWSPELQFRCTLFTFGNPPLDVTGRNEVSGVCDISSVEESHIQIKLVKKM